MKYLLPFIFIFMFCVTASAALHTETVEYQHGVAVLEGYLAYDDSLKGKAPAVLIVHEWTGIGPYIKKRAEQIASLGYVAFAVDIYGKGIRSKDRDEASKQASLYRQDRQLMRERALAGLRQAIKFKFVDEKKIVVIGYCFGGGVALELARSGAAISGAISFHGNLDTPNPGDAKNIRAKILILHGADDPHITPEQITAFQREMRNAKADWQMIFYGNAVHSFTNPESGDNPGKGAAYNQKADARSWEAMQAFFKEIF